MNAVMTIVLCLVQDPASCEVREFEVEASVCYTASLNVAEASTPPGYRLRSSRCLPKLYVAQQGNVG
jgi:hypothetical protein